MGKEWVTGRNCQFKVEYGGVPVGTKAWVYKVSREDVTFLTKKEGTVSLKEVVIPTEEAENFVVVKPGKPRDNFAVLFEAPKPASGNVASAGPRNPEVDAILAATLGRIAGTN